LSAFYDTRRFITVFTTARHWSLSLARCIQPALSHPIPLSPFYHHNHNHPSPPTHHHHHHLLIRLLLITFHVPKQYMLFIYLDYSTDMFMSYHELETAEINKQSDGNLA